MHNVELPQDLIEFVMTRRGRIDVFDYVDPVKTALLVIDMQNAYVEENAPLFLPWAYGIIPNINKVAASLRDHGGLVIWLQHQNGKPGTPDYWSMYFDNFVDENKRDALSQALNSDSHYFSLFQELDVQDDDLVMAKFRFSSLIQSSSDLHERLRDRGIDTLIITGTLTNVCCESTARDAMMLDYRVFMPIDGTAARSDNDHLSGLRTICQAMGDVRPCAEVIKLIEEVEM